MLGTRVNTSNRLLVRFAGALLLFIGWITMANAAYVEPNDCGGDKQSPCYLSSARYLGQVMSDKPQSDAFKDPRNNGEWWTCDGWRRTVFAVTASNACETGTWPFKLSYKYARYLGPTHNPQPADSFIDLRLDAPSAGSQYWQCPKNFYRNANGVTHPEACSANIGSECDDGNVNVGNPLGGYTCYKKFECGAVGQRPCLLWERVPSCNSGLKEDFLDGKCVDSPVAQCLTGARAFKLARDAASFTSKGIELATKLADEVMKDLPMYDDMKTIGSDKTLGFKNTLFGSVTETENTLRTIDAAMGAFGAYVPEVIRLRESVKNNQTKLLDFFADSDKCGQSKSERIATLLEILGYRIPADVNVQLAGNDTSWVKKVFDAVIPPANAAYGDNVYLILGISANASYIVGGTFGTYMAVDLRSGEVGGFVSLGPSVTVSSAYFGSQGKLGDGGVGFFGGFMAAESMDDVGGWGGSVEFTVQPGDSSTYKNIVLGMDIMVNDLANGLQINGVAFNLGVAREKEFGAISAGISYAYDWRLGKSEYVSLPVSEVSAKNIATGKKATMSSEHSAYKASNAVNGIRSESSDFAHNSNYVSGEWWQVDLDGVYLLTSSNWYNRVGCCGDRMNNYAVQGSLDGISWFTIDSQTTQMAYPTTINLNNSKARYVRLVQKNNLPINFAEVEIFGTKVNEEQLLSQGKTASMSSTLNSTYTAARAVDGITTGASPDFAHTAVAGIGQWWQVDLGSVKYLTRSEWYNRTDCCSARMDNYTISISTDGKNWTTINSQKSQMARPTKISINANARYVRLTQQKNEVINFSEAKIFGFN